MGRGVRQHGGRNAAPAGKRVADHYTCFIFQKSPVRPMEDKKGPSVPKRPRMRVLKSRLLG